MTTLSPDYFIKMMRGMKLDEPADIDMVESSKLSKFINPKDFIV